MNIAHKSIILSFILALLPALFIPALWPSLRLTFLAPFLIIVYYQYPLSSSLWFAGGCGLLIDILASNQRLGLYTLNFCLTTWLLHNQRQNFFSDKLSTLPIMTFFFAILSTLIQVILLYVLDKGISLSLPWALTDLLLMPLADATYAFLWFILPSFIFSKRPLRGEEYFQQPNKKPKA